MASPFPIDFPPYDLKFGNNAGQRTIFDIIRKQHVALTPEEMVRQHIIHYMLTEKGYPKSLLAIEMGLSYNQMSRRCDIVAYNNSGVPTLIVECKAPDVKLSQKTFEQVARYNEILKVPYLLISNGSECYCARIELQNGSFTFEQEVPAYQRVIV